MTPIAKSSRSETVGRETAETMNEARTCDSYAAICESVRNPSNTSKT